MVPLFIWPKYLWPLGKVTFLTGNAMPACNQDMHWVSTTNLFFFLGILKSGRVWRSPPLLGWSLMSISSPLYAYQIGFTWGHCCFTSCILHPIASASALRCGIHAPHLWS